MDLRNYYIEEDLFPSLFTNCLERPYGILFYNPDNKDSFDSNHAVIYKDKIDNLGEVLKDISEFYKSKGCRAIIYQSMLDDRWFEEIKNELTAAGYKSWTELQEYMLPLDENKICPNKKLEVKKITAWSDAVENVFLEAEEPWEIQVAKKSLENPDCWMFAVCLEGKIIGLLYGHISQRACRVDYLLVSKKHRNIGAGRALFYEYVEWTKRNNIKNVYIWPAGEKPKKIYEEGGYRIVEVRKAGRAVYVDRL